MKITSEWTIGEIIRRFPSSAEIFKGYGLNCFGCPSANGETLLTAAISHGLEIEILLVKLNAACENDE